MVLVLFFIKWKTSDQIMPEVSVILEIVVQQLMVSSKLQHKGCFCVTKLHLQGKLVLSKTFLKSTSLPGRTMQNIYKTMPPEGRSHCLNSKVCH